MSHFRLRVRRPLSQEIYSYWTSLRTILKSALGILLLIAIYDSLTRYFAQRRIANSERRRIEDERRICAEIARQQMLAELEELRLKREKERQEREKRKKKEEAEEKEWQRHDTVVKNFLAGIGEEERRRLEAGLEAHKPKFEAGMERLRLLHEKERSEERKKKGKARDSSGA
ncbi:uncharacterized protein RAG0_01353 [Rhynchosporium agropyri]|uniref:Uncharacterized protein n=1 Tax=Rhynchosporium agropyri TaxID=914238 RepID=A0A1E1JWX0_9HELO|nr:uncharacterized protein RAG0_01353 [Rhynchosporium agropyri]